MLSYSDRDATYTSTLKAHPCFKSCCKKRTKTAGKAASSAQWHLSNCFLKNWVSVDSWRSQGQSLSADLVLDKIKFSQDRPRSMRVFSQPTHLILFLSFSSSSCVVFRLNLWSLIRLRYHRQIISFRTIIGTSLATGLCRRLPSKAI